MARSDTNSAAALKGLGIRVGGNLTKVKAQNLTAVLLALRKLQPVSRSDLAGTLGLTPATMTNLVAELVQLGFIRETRSPEKQLGRRPTLLRLNPEVATFIGVEISRTHVSGIRVNLEGEVLARLSRKAPASAGAEATLATTHAVIRRLWRSEAPPVGIGVGVPGPVDSAFGVVLEPPNFLGWRRVPLGKLLHDRWGVPVKIDDDAKAAAVGEHWFGQGRGVTNLLYLSIGTGVGAGLIVQDKLYRGAHELAGEIGHTTLDLDGPQCACGNRGCLETFVSASAITARAQHLIGARALDSGLEAALKELHQQTVQGVRKAQDVKEVTYRYLAAGITNAVNFYDPDLIILGGLLPTAWPDLVVEMRSRVQGKSFGFVSDALTLVQSLLGTTAPLLGSASLVMQTVFETPRLVQLKPGTALL